MTLDLVVPQRFYVSHQQAGFGDRHVYASRLVYRA
jgi:DNA helicase-2/ATP-dependent DNA helicase PcrA